MSKDLEAWEMFDMVLDRIEERAVTINKKSEKVYESDLKIKSIESDLNDAVKSCKYKQTKLDALKIMVEEFEKVDSIAEEHAERHYGKTFIIKRVKKILNG